MDEFRRLPWPSSDFGTDLHQTYALNMPEFQQRNPTDVFFCNLMNIDPLHLQHENQNQNESSGEGELTPRQFIDPRTGIEIPSHVCNYKNIDLKTRNIFLTKYIQVSNLQRHEHLTCLNALARLPKPETELSNEEKKDRLLFNATAVLRSEEKKAFLEKLRERFFAEVPNRFHNVPPSIEYFVTQNWKEQLVMMHRQFVNARFSLKTAILLQPSECVVTTNAVHQEHLGCVPQMSRDNLEYLRQSFPNLMKAHNMRKNTHQLPAIKGKVKDLVQQHKVDFVIPISILKCILGSKTGWSFCMTVKESALSTVFNPKKEIICEKPLPPAYLSGNDRYKKGAKYLLHSCFNANALYVYNHNEKIESRTSTQAIECDSNTSTAIEYKVSNCDEFIRNHARGEDSYGNMTFTIFDVKGYNSADDINESFKILVPTKQAAYKKDSNGEIKFINWSPKIEFQAEYGVEVMRKDELISEWCELYFRPNTSTERVRFDCITGKVIHHQTITSFEVENELRTNYGIERQQLLQRLWHALQTFNDFPPGDYLLQSDSKHLDSIKIFEKTNSTGSVGISQIIKSATNAPILEKNLLDKVDWQPIDDNISIEIHKNYKILPCAFPHSDYLRENNVKPPRDERMTPTRAPGAIIMSKICPKDDTSGIIKSTQSRKRAQEHRFKMRGNQSKKHKKLKQRARKQAKIVEQKMEIHGLKSAKRLLAATMDQFNTPSGESFAEPNMKPGDSSIAARTRKRSECDNSGDVQPSTSAKQFTRRSSRIPMNKAN
ncbi:uncharacterized protein LOC129570703 [Sitodiplosis mosellana]|uniref:uncharacterized protein LOC129570703 n=1 Tax=Sitodiplosis mosellana TaxID=263140 RepID=UPI002444645C|nr:uncharacterized protein LOC129570703 [Sitodiplosis mosellana]